VINDFTADWPPATADPLVFEAPPTRPALSGFEPEATAWPSLDREPNLKPENVLGGVSVLSS